LTSPADLAAFTGFARVPISVSGHATGGATSSNGDVTTAFNTQTSATITVIYHYTPNLGGTDPAPGGSTSPPSSGTNPAPGTTTNLASGGTSPASTTTVADHGSSKTRLVTHPHHKAHPLHRVKPSHTAPSRHHPKGLVHMDKHKG
jgi:hypothetical protein